MNEELPLRAQAWITWEAWSSERLCSDVGRRPAECLDGGNRKSWSSPSSCPATHPTVGSELSSRVHGHSPSYAAWCVLEEVQILWVRHGCDHETDVAQGSSTSSVVSVSEREAVQLTFLPPLSNKDCLISYTSDKSRKPYRG